MTVRSAILQLLDEGDRHGYQLKVDFEARTGGIWPLNVGQVYTTLDRLLRDGMVEQIGPQTEAGQRTYRITEDGRRDVKRWLEASPVDADPPRDELIMKVLLAIGRGPEEALALHRRPAGGPARRAADGAAPATGRGRRRRAGQAAGPRRSAVEDRGRPGLVGAMRRADEGGHAPGERTMTIRVTQTGGPVLEMTDVVKRYGSGTAEVRALTNVSITVERGEFVAMMGPSGSGKSTLLHLAGGLERPSAGQVVVDGHDLDALDAGGLAALRRRTVGYIFQRLNLVPTLTAVENVMLPLELDGVSVRKARKEAIDALRMVAIEGPLDRFPDDLSGGQQQRVAIARAIVGERGAAPGRRAVRLARHGDRRPGDRAAGVARDRARLCAGAGHPRTSASRRGPTASCGCGTGCSPRRPARPPSATRSPRPDDEAQPPPARLPPGPPRAAPPAVAHGARAPDGPGAIGRDDPGRRLDPHLRVESGRRTAGRDGRADASAYSDQAIPPTQADLDNLLAVLPAGTRMPGHALGQRPGSHGRPPHVPRRERYRAR